MTDQELKKLNRQDLLRLLLEMEKENETLRAEAADAKQQLEAHRVAVSEAGSLAEASLRLGGVFEAAQRAADIYVQNAEEVCQEQKRKATETLHAAEQNCREMEESCRAECERLRADAQREADACLQNAQQVSQEQERRATEAAEAAERNCREMQDACQAECARLREETQLWAADYREKVVKPLREYVRMNPEVFEALESK